MKNSNFTGSYGYRLDVEGLRGLAVLAVVFYHMGLSFFEGGFVGVDVFFVISGYLITRTIIFDVQNANFSVLEFYNKRARKILQSLFVVVVVSLIVGAMVMPPEPYQSMSKSALSALLFLSNFYLQSEVNYFDAAAELKPPTTHLEFGN